VFVITLAVLTGLVVLISALATTNREATRGQAVRMEDRRARLMLEAGIQRAIAELQQQSPGRVGLRDGWATLGEGGETRFTVGRDSFRLQILDSSARIDVNSADEELLKKLPLTSEQIASLLDWREAKPAARAEGAKDDYYNRLPNPYNAKLKPFESLDELLLVRGFTHETLNTRPRNTTLTSGTANMPPLADLITVDSLSSDKDIAGKAKLDINSATADQLMGIGIPKPLGDAIVQARGAGFKKLGDALKVQNMTKEAARSLLDNTAIGKEPQHKGLINVNTASESVLSAIPELTSDARTAILDRQRTGFKSLGELVNVPGVELPVLAATVDRFCVGSNAFVVRVAGIAGTAHVAAEATLVLEEDGGVRLARVQPEPYRPARERWGWATETTGEVALGVAR
jgi:general secretion pathway protein K